MVYDYTLCYNPEDGKLHVGRGCSEEKEKFIGEITDEIADVGGYTGEGSTLRLKDFSFATSADLALAVPGGTTILLEGKNALKVVNDKPEANVGVLYSSGDLAIGGGDSDSLDISAETGQGLWSRAICARAGDLAINGGRITASGGDAKKSCGLYAGGRLFIDIGDKGKIAINGGSVTITAKTAAVRAAEGRMTIAAGAKVTNAKEFGGGEAFQGDCLCPVDGSVPVTVSFIQE